jgi:hypothetical protein
MTFKSSPADEIDESMSLPSLFKSLIEVCEGLRIEWTKSRARAARWSEEVTLLLEEMGRVLRYLEWKATWWAKQANCRSGVSPDLQEGLVAYCAKQGSILHKMATSFSAEWYPLLSGYGIDSDWPEWTIPSGLSKSTSILPLASFQDDSGEADIEDNFLEDDIFGE